MRCAAQHEAAMTKSTSVSKARIRRLLAEAPSTSSDIARDLGMSLGFATSYLRRMELDGEIERVGEDGDVTLWATCGGMTSTPSSIVAQAIRGRTPLEMVWSAA